MAGRHTEFEAWVRDVRDPANAAHEGRRRVSSGRVVADYWIAEISSGWAWRAAFQISGQMGCSVPWSAVGCRNAAVDGAVAFLRRCAASEAGRESCVVPEDCRLVRERLDESGLFGFLEPAGEAGVGPYELVGLREEWA